MPHPPENSLQDLIRRAETAEGEQTLKTILLEALAMVLTIQENLRTLAQRIRALEETAPNQAALEETRADMQQLLDIAAGTSHERFAMAARRCIYDENWQEADTALAAFREPGEMRDLALRIRGRLLDLAS